MSAGQAAALRLDAIGVADGDTAVGALPLWIMASATRCIGRIGVVDSDVMDTMERRLCSVFGVELFPEGER